MIMQVNLKILNYVSMNNVNMINKLNIYKHIVIMNY